MFVATAVLRRLKTAEAAVFALALAGRMLPLMLSGQLLGNWGYDASVYYSASSALLHGEVPYRDFTLLHPPGIVIVELPFALLGRMTTDMTGFVAANLFFALLGSIAAVVVVRVGMALSLSRRAAVTAGVVYALWFGPITAEYLARLEPLGNLFMALGLLAFVRAVSGHHSRRLGAWGMPLAAGAAFGAAISVKIWWIVPIVLYFGWAALKDRRAAVVGRAALGIAACALVIDGPFLAIARTKMWNLVVADQLGRPANNLNPTRPLSFLTVGWLSLARSHRTLVTICVVGGIAFIFLIVQAWRRFKPGRPVVVALVAQVLLLAVAPSWYTIYADYVTIPLALTFAAAFTPAAAERADRARLWTGRLFVPAVAVVLGLFLLNETPDNYIAKLPRAKIAAALAGVRCVVVDSQITLIATNRLTATLDDHCPDWIDNTGRRFDLDRLLGFPPGIAAPIAWNKLMLPYLQGADAVVLLNKPTFLSLNKKTIATLEQTSTLTKIGGISIFRATVQHAATGPVASG